MGRKLSLDLNGSRLCWDDLELLNVIKHVKIYKDLRFIIYWTDRRFAEGDLAALKCAIDEGQFILGEAVSKFEITMKEVFSAEFHFCRQWYRCPVLAAEN